MYSPFGVVVYTVQVSGLMHTHTCTGHYYLQTCPCDEAKWKQEGGGYSLWHNI